MIIQLATSCPDAEDYLRIAQIAAREAGEYIHEQFRGTVTVDFKSHPSDVVTEHDRRAEQMIRTAIEQAAPSSLVVGEEYGGSGANDLVWYVDPIDGTSNFVNGLPFYCVSIGVCWRGQPLGGVIYDPERNEMFVGSAYGLFLNGRRMTSQAASSDGSALCLTNLPHEGLDDNEGIAALGQLIGAFRAVRRLGSSALALAYVAVGRADICAEMITKPWDHAAGVALVLAGGGGVVARDSQGNGTTDAGQIARYLAYGTGFPVESSLLSRILMARQNG